MCGCCGLQRGWLAVVVGASCCGIIFDKGQVWNFG